MSILATDKKLISFGTDYSAGSGISIIDHTISIVPSAVGKTYSAGPNIEIYDVSGQPTISSKDWSNEISDASANSYTQSTSYFNEWKEGQYTGDITSILNQINGLSGDYASLSSFNELSDSVSSLSSTVNTNSGTWNDVTNKLYISSYHELSAGANINITDYVVSSKDWSNEISQASANAYNEATALIPTLTFSYLEI